MLTASTWPIAAALLPFPSHRPASADWTEDLQALCQGVLAEVSDAGFDAVDLTDTWLPYGDLSPAQLEGLAQTLADCGLRALSMSVIRRSVIADRDGEANLAYSHRCIDAAAALGVGIVSVGLHQPLTPAQRDRLWFWTAPGHRDPDGDPVAWALAVTRLGELGAHAADAGILLSLELYEHTYLGTAASAVRLVEEIGMPGVGLNPDTGNLARLPEPIEDWREVLERTMPWANFWHVKNYARDENPDTGLVSAVPSYLESGLIDYRSAVRIALGAGFQGVICTEHYGGDGLSMSAANRDYLRARVLPRTERAIGRSLVRQQFPDDAAARV